MRTILRLTFARHDSRIARASTIAGPSRSNHAAVERDERQDRERIKAVDLAVGQIEKQFGKGSIMRLGQKGAIQPIDAIPTGAISIDYALGVGGVPRGRVIEIFGPESSGKTTLALQVIAEAQKLGGMAAFVDAEHALDAAYAQKLGVDIDNLLVSQPDNGEQALEIVEVLVRSDGVDVVVVDSVAALVPKAEIEGEMGDAQMGLQARLMSQALRKLTGVGLEVEDLPHLHQPAAREDRRHVRQSRNDDRRPRAEVLRLGAHGHPPHRQHQGRRRGRRRPDAREGGQEQGRAAVPRGRVRRHVRRRHLARPATCSTSAVDKRIIEKSGAWFAYGGERLGQGRENAKQFLKDNPEIYKAIEERVRRELGLTARSRSRRRLTLAASALRAEG